ncbi:MAG: SDR family oxidoreductase [Nanoarchaeota archaeon]|nr:SDR family oxidoreductase [Nanoarchaeota archaeon]MBU1976517.1 SDR family oxidoreductase [Nanoarchaeota archaeon]
MEIQDKVALVTGSTRGIGRAIGERLCSLGAIVYFNSHNSQDEGTKLVTEFQKEGLKSFYVTGDVSSEDGAKKIFETIQNEQGRLDILVNNAGIYRKDDTDYEDYSAIHRVNGYGYFLCSLLASQMMKFGKIVNISSIYGVNPDQDSILASGVKSEVEAYTKAFAKKLRGKIEVNSVAPGYTDTPLLRASLSPEFIDNIVKNTAIKRLVEPEEIAEAVVSLIQNDGITGQTIVVDGGYTL